GAAQSAARAKGAERFEGFMQTLGKRLATGDRFLKELSRDIDAAADTTSEKS
ncbi:TPA: CopG family transcriptional regulator, partial [Pseudomonas aeruginosa]|nr:CopG family transcriptional regulator [Pseudomonas aeruginosa]